MTRVLLVDDHAFVRAQIAEILTATPDVVLMDVRMPIKSGIEATRDLMAVAPHVRVLMLTGSPTPGAVLESAEAGAVGLLLKGGDADLLIDAVRTVAAGGTAWAIEPAAVDGAGPGYRRIR